MVIGLFPPSLSSCSLLIGMSHVFSIGHKYNTWTEFTWQHSNNWNRCAVISSWWTYISRRTFSYLSLWSFWQCSVSLEAGYYFNMIQFNIAVFPRCLQRYAGDPMWEQQFLMTLFNTLLSFILSYVTSSALDHCHKGTLCSCWLKGKAILLLLPLMHWTKFSTVLYIHTS